MFIFYRRVFNYLIQSMLLFSIFFFCVSSTLYASEGKSSNSSATEQTQPTFEAKSAQKSLKDLKVALANATTTIEIDKLSEDTQVIIKKIDEFIAYQKMQLEALNTSLIALSELKPIEVEPEKNDEVVQQADDKIISQKRERILKEQDKINLSINEATELKSLANEVLQEIARVRQQKFKSQLTTKNASVLSFKFWQPILEPTQAQSNRFKHFSNKFTESIATVLDGISFNLIYVVGAVLFWFIVRLFLERVLYQFSIKYIPFGRFRRSFLLAALPFFTVLATLIALNLLFKPITSQLDVSVLVLDFIEGFIELAGFCALVTGLGRAFLANRIPSRRLIDLPNNIAKELTYFPVLIAVVALSFGTIEIINNVTGVIVGLTVWTTGLSALIIALLIIVYPIRIYHTHSNDEELNNSSKKGMIHVLLLFSSLFIIITSILGYISLSSYVAYQTLWIMIVILGYYGLKQFSKDFWQAIFYPSNPSAKLIKQTLNLNDKLLEQIKIILTALSHCALLLGMIMALLNGSFSGATTQTLFDKVLNLLTANGLEGFGIVPQNLTNAVVILFISIYVLSVSKKWLSKEFLPKTSLDIGISASLVTLYSNIGYVLIIMFTLAALGIEWSKLAWIVSALSVGIGFGLQEIVKNFISGIILLTERPVKVGDSIGIAGIEGDIKRINVRATEIQLSDRSTVIVPNSQLIAQNVKNNSKNNPKGVVSIELNFAIDSDPELIQSLLLDAYRSHSSILAEPTPEVRFSQLNSSEINLTVTGSVQSPRLVGKTKSDLLFIILKELRVSGIYPSAEERTPKA
ncbi:DUF3772 domain-containing protein [Thorsellia kenyensis]|uniref:DUF3772 domain-containing protein n=1 Tax=Thorsellia kenyensis TaxID=1549888 RepID=A0ABV6CBY0_9GAMM